MRDDIDALVDWQLTESPAAFGDSAVPELAMAPMGFWGEKW